MASVVTVTEESGVRTPPRTQHLESRLAARMIRLEPWSVLKTSFIFSFLANLALFFLVFGRWKALLMSGLLNELDSLIATFTGTSADNGGLSIFQFVNETRVIGAAAVVSSVMTVLGPAMLTVFVGFFNLTTRLTGGVEVTLAQNAD